MKSQKNGHVYRTFSLFDFESMFSPGILAAARKAGWIIPIKPDFAKTLLGEAHSGQLRLLQTGPLALERAYFSRAKCRIPVGSLLFFYVSGRGHQLLRYFARCTFCGHVSASEARTKFFRQGVISQNSLDALSQNGLVHVIAFDNFNLLPCPVDFRELKSRGIISGANLVTTQGLTMSQLDETLKLIDKQGREE